MFGFDKLLLENFTFDFEDDIDLYVNLLTYFADSAQEKATAGDTTYFTYYPQYPLDNNGSLQLVVETKRNEKTKRNEICDFFFHHTGWYPTLKVKVVHEVTMEDYENVYMVENENSELVVMRLVNAKTLGKIKKGDIVEVQPSLMASDVKIFDSHSAYMKSLGDHVGLAEGTVLPYDFVVNNSAELSEEEQKNRPHFLDSTVLVCGKVSGYHPYKWCLMGEKMPTYFRAGIETSFGEMHMFFSVNNMKNNCSTKDAIPVGTFVVARAILSGDVCVGNNEKYQGCNQEQN